MDVARQISLLTDRNLEAGRGDKVAVITDDGTPVTFAEVHRLACRFAARLRDHGVRREERVLLVLDDTPRFHAAFLGCLRAGAVPVPVNLLMRPEDFGYFLEDSYAVLAVVDAPFVPAVAPHAARLGVPLLVGGGEDGSLTVEAWLAEGPEPRRRRHPSRRHGLLALQLGLDRQARRASCTCSTTSRSRARPTRARCSASARTTSRSRPRSSSTPTASATASRSRSGSARPRC